MRLGMNGFSMRVFSITAGIIFVSTFLQGCGQATDQSNRRTAPAQQPVPNLPESHGPMQFEPGVSESPTPAPEAPEGGVVVPPVNTSGEAIGAGTESIEGAEGDAGAAVGSGASEGSGISAPDLGGITGSSTVPATPLAPTTTRQPLCQDSHQANAPSRPGLICPACVKGRFTQPQPAKSKLDVLFVADTSPSIETQRIAIAAGVRQFVAALPTDTDYRFAVMAAHSDVSYDQANKPSTRLAGKLLTAGGGQAVLKREDFGDMNRLSQALHRKLTRMPLDSATDGGEAGLYSLDKGISEPLLSENRRLGFFREDAALAVIFISDENDICSYGVNYPEGVIPKVNVNKYLTSGLTVEEKANQVYCRDQAGNPIVTSRSVFAKLRELKQVTGRAAAALPPSGTAASPSAATSATAMPLLVSGVLFTEAASVPTTPPPDERYPEYFGEKEVGYGYLDLINDNQGVAVDISKANFSEGLRQIGEAAALKLEVKSEFQLREGKSIDDKTLCVVVDNREVREVNDFTTRVDGMSYLFKPELREVHLRGIGSTNPRGEASRVEVFYCEPPSVLEYDPERYLRALVPTEQEHYRSLPVPRACSALKARLESI